MSVPTVIPLRHVRVSFARARQALGWAGLGGLALMVVAAVVFGLAWAARSNETAPSPAPSVELARGPSADDASAEAAPLPAPDFPRPDDVPLLLTQIKQIAITNGLSWSAADYRLVPPTDVQPASLEVRSNFKGPYPKLRRMLSQVLQQVPAAAIREMSLSRSSSDAVDIEAKVTIAVWLQDDPASPRRGPTTKGAP